MNPVNSAALTGNCMLVADNFLERPEFGSSLPAAPCQSCCLQGLATGPAYLSREESSGHSPGGSETGGGPVVRSPPSAAPDRSRVAFGRRWTPLHRHCQRGRLDRAIRIVETFKAACNTAILSWRCG